MEPIFKIKTYSKVRFFKNLSLSLIFLTSFILIFFNKSDYFLVNKIKTITNDYVNPITRIITSPLVIVSNIKNTINDFNSLKNENLILREEIMRLKKWQILAIQNSRENNALKKLMNATDNTLNLIKTAAVLNRNDVLYAKMININAGKNDGLQQDMTAINHRGLIGRVIESGSNISRIMLLTDPNLSISVKSISDNFLSILNGAPDGKHLVSSFIKVNQLPKVGDLVVTSGSAQIFPQDILVGKIVDVQKNKFYVLPFVDFNNIDYVQIVKSE
tara:strand:- start:17422 stop:18243 length:822 start_codon:yes stop_codon:yes gene_type:complete